MFWCGTPHPIVYVDGELLFHLYSKTVLSYLMFVLSPFHVDVLAGVETNVVNKVT